MKSTKYYYSKPIYKVLVEAWTNGQGDIVLMPDKTIPQKAQRLHRVTVASVYDRTEGTLSFGVSVCSPKDSFSKKVGREIAYNRAIEKPNKKVIVKKNNIRSLSVKYANELIEKYLKKYV